MSREPGPSDVAPSSPRLARTRELQELWFVLARRPWRSLVLAPVYPEGSAEEIARSLAEVGKHVSDMPVSAVTLKVLGPGSARALAALAQHVQRSTPVPLLRGHVPESGEPSPRGTVEIEDPPVIEAPSAAAVGQLIISIPSLVTEPLGLAVAQAADAVILGIELGRTNMADAKRTIDLIGRDRVMGSVILR